MADKQIRLLACKQCKTIEEIPDFAGNPRDDHLLTYALERHKTNDTPHIGALFKVPEKDWDNTEAQRTIANQIGAKLDGGETGLGSAFYDLKNNFQADAMACWKAHNRNPACSDYKSASKRLTPDTKAERKEAGLSEYRSAKDRYLCEFCPVQSLVEQAFNEKNLK